jgi:hypothetical protein
LKETLRGRPKYFIGKEILQLRIPASFSKDLSKSSKHL